MVELKRSDTCPDLLHCEAPVTKPYYEKVCRGTYENCNHFARPRKQLCTPVEWLQRAAVATMHVEEEEVEPFHYRTSFKGPTK